MSGTTGTFADTLRRLRERAGLSQDELAARADVSSKAVGALERGERRRPYPHTVRALADALGLGDDDRAALVAAARPAAAPEPSFALPAPVTPLVGREAERAEVVGLLRSGATRLVTLTGPGGVGKTSLALDVARALAPDFPDGVAVVELAPVTDPALVLPAVASALGVRQFGPSLLESLAAFVGARRRLVVLDNLEQVLDAAPDVADLLARCSGLVVLATSRAALRLRAERDMPLGPLPLPSGSDPGSVGASPAVQVFLDRARAAGRSVELTGTTTADVAAICRRLDGLPLAIELAAAHARFLSPAALLARLDSAVQASGPRDLPARQRTVRATLDWSHDLLTADEQVLLRRLSVFAGGSSLEGAQAVFDGDVVPVLGGLVEQSLAVPSAGDRYRMLEPVRQYAAVRLTEAGEADAVADRAAGFFRTMAAGARAGLRSADQAPWLDSLQAEHDNLGATFDRLLASGQDGAAARLAADTWLYWALRGNTVEVLGWIRRVREGVLSAGERAGLHLATAGLAFAAGDVPGTASAAILAVDAATEAGDDVARGEALVLAGSAAVFLGSYAEAAGLLAEGRRIGERLGYEWALAHIAMAEGQLHFGTGDLAATRTAMDEAERTARSSGNSFTLATVLNMQATLALAADDDQRALARWAESAELAAEVETTWTLAYTVSGLAVLAARCELPELAAELFAAGSATAEAASVAVSFPPDLQFVAEYLARVRTSLGEDAFRRAWERGRAIRPADVPRLAEAISARCARA